MSSHVNWDAGYATGDAGIDDRHRRLLAQCNALAELLPADGVAYSPDFQAQFDALVESVRQLFAAEQSRLDGCPSQSAHGDEIDEFEYLVADIATAENFDAVEVQRFLALWCVGHVAGFGDRYRGWLQSQPPA